MKFSASLIVILPYFAALAAGLTVPITPGLVVRKGGNNNSNNNNNGGNTGSNGNSTGNNGNTGSTGSSTGSTGSSTGSTSTSGNTGGSSNSSSADAQSSLTLDPSVIATGFEDNGQDEPAAGQVASLTSSNNFINFCATTGQQITNGKQVTGGSCNPAPMGQIPSTANMPSAKFINPVNMQNIAANTDFNVQLAIQGMETGNFVNAEEDYFSAPQQLNAQGQIVGHSHVVIEQLDSLTQTTPTNPSNFAFFKGLNDAAVNGVLNTTVTGGLPDGVYKISTINSAANHQPVLVAVAQHGSLDDVVYFTVGSAGASTGTTGSNNGSSGSTSTGNNGASGSTSTGNNGSGSSNGGTGSSSSSAASSTSTSAAGNGNNNDGNNNGGNANGGTSSSSSSAASSTSTSAAGNGSNNNGNNNGGNNNDQGNAQGGNAAGSASGGNANGEQGGNGGKSKGAQNGSGNNGGKNRRLFSFRHSRLH